MTNNITDGLEIPLPGALWPTFHREPHRSRYAENAGIPRRNWPRLLAGFGEFDFDAKLDFGQDLVEPGIAGRGFQVGRRSAQRATVLESNDPASSPILRSSSTSSAVRPRATDRLRRSVESSTPCMASNASMPLAARGGAAERVSAVVPTSPREKAVELERRALAAGVAKLVPLGP